MKTTNPWHPGDIAVLVIIILAALATMAGPILMCNP
jgi:hypothetical protein